MFLTSNKYILSFRNIDILFQHNFYLTQIHAIIIANFLYFKFLESIIQNCLKTVLKIKIQLTISLHQMMNTIFNMDNKQQFIHTLNHHFESSLFSSS
jgi:hypothetical protein